MIRDTILSKWLIPSVLAVTLMGCGDGEGLGPESRFPRIDVIEGNHGILPGSVIPIAADMPTAFKISNLGGSAPLRVSELFVDSKPVGAFTLNASTLPSEASPIEVFPDAAGYEFEIHFDRSRVPAGTIAEATVHIRTNITINLGSEFTFFLSPGGNVAHLAVSPSILDFAVVQADSTSTKTANLLNTSGAPATIQRIIFAGHTGFSAIIDGKTYRVTAESANHGVNIVPPLTIAPGSAAKVDVSFAPSGFEAAQATIIFFEDDDSYSTSSELKLYANLQGPCIKTSPTRVSFGGKLVAQSSEIGLDIESCGQVDLVVSDIVMIEDANGVFEVNESALGAFPLTIPAGGKVTVPVTYFPTLVARVGADGQFVLDDGMLRIKSNAYLAELDVPIDGFGTDGQCPVAKIDIAEGDEVVPQTRLHLSGRGSTASVGSVVGYAWSVIQPDGSLSTLAPSPYVTDPTFDVNVIGTYIFRLAVTDSLGIMSCAPTEKTVVVTSDDALHFELLWHTPGDINESDTGGDQAYFSVGTDLDLHLLHDVGFSWFDPDHDCFRNNPNPDWGASGPDNDPRYDRDDTDGAGPENINMGVPEEGRRYRLGVHYWDDWGYGASFATVRVYVYGVLRDQWADVQLGKDDFWETHTIDWPSGIVTRVGTTPTIIPKYRETHGL